MRILERLSCCEFSLIETFVSYYALHDENPFQRERFHLTTVRAVIMNGVHIIVKQYCNCIFYKVI
jgi:hypothetical protein